MTSRLEELIAELCPNGVEYKKVKDTYLRIKGTPITASKMKEIASEDGEVRIFAGGKTVINAHESDIPRANITRVPAVLVQSRGVIDAVYYDKPFTFKNEMWAYTSNNPISVKFLYYLLKNNIQYFRDAASGMGSLPQISLHVTEDFEIPVPPLEIQSEIVRILDTFTEITAELTENLTAELTARKKQYEYYRDTLLTFNDNNPLHSLISHYCPNGVEYKKIGDIADYEQPTKYIVKSTKYDDSFATPVLTAGQSFILGYTDELDNIYLASKDNPVIIFDDFTGAIQWVDFSFKVKSSAMKMITAKPNVLIRYLYHWMALLGFSSSEHKRLWISTYSNFEIPVPPLEVQRQIVQILDRFDALCNDLTQGLPAEIEARRKQYEYYRDKLLTFKRA